MYRKQLFFLVAFAQNWKGFSVRNKIISAIRHRRVDSVRVQFAVSRAC